MHLMFMLLVMSAFHSSFLYNKSAFHVEVPFNHTAVLQQFIPVSESSENARTSTINDVMLGNN